MEDNLQVIIYSTPRNSEVPTTLYLSIDYALGSTNLTTLSITKLQVAAETILGINYIQALPTMSQTTIPYVVPFPS